MSDGSYRLSLAPSARRALVDRPPRGLPLAVATAVTQFLTGAWLDNPQQAARPSPDVRMPLPAQVVRIGRVPHNDLVLADLDVSRHHAELRTSPATGHEIVDLGSHGGTFVNGQRVSARRLTAGDLVSIGHSTFRLQDGELVLVADDGQLASIARDLAGNAVPLSRGLAGYRSVRRGAYRVVYRLDEAARVVHVVRLDHRTSVYHAPYRGAQA